MSARTFVSAGVTALATALLTVGALAAATPNAMRLVLQPGALPAFPATFKAPSSLTPAEVEAVLGLPARRLGLVSAAGAGYRRAATDVLDTAGPFVLVFSTRAGAHSAMSSFSTSNGPGPMKGRRVPRVRLGQESSAFKATTYPFAYQIAWRDRNVVAFVFGSGKPGGTRAGAVAIARAQQARIASALR